MAKTIKASSDKTFGGNAVLPGTYKVNGAIIVEETLTLPGQPQTNYDSLQLQFLTETDQPVEATLSLNGCWRARRGSDDVAYKASGSFFDILLKECHGKSFTVTRDYINTSLKGRKVSVNYREYPSQNGGFGRVPVVEFLA